MPTSEARASRERFVNARTWLPVQISSSPPALIEAMSAMLPATDDDADASATLAEAALSLYRSVIRGTGGREDALALLAADALFTHAFQAQAELDPEGLRRFIAEWSDGSKLATVLTPDPESK